MLISTTAAETAEGVFSQYSAGEFGIYSLIGFFIVIAVLIVLIVLLIVFSKLLNLVSSIKVSKKASGTPSETASAVSAEDDTETVAAITAALMAYYDVQTTVNGEDDMPVPFIIRSIKKI